MRKATINHMINIVELLSLTLNMYSGLLYAFFAFLDGFLFISFLKIYQVFCLSFVIHSSLNYLILISLSEHLLDVLLLICIILN